MRNVVLLPKKILFTVLGQSLFANLFFQAIITDPFMLDSVILVFANKQDLVSQTNGLEIKRGWWFTKLETHRMLTKTQHIILKIILVSYNMSRVLFFFIFLSFLNCSPCMLYFSGQPHFSMFDLNWILFSMPQILNEHIVEGEDARKARPCRSRIKFKGKKASWFLHCRYMYRKEIIDLNLLINYLVLFHIWLKRFDWMLVLKGFSLHNTCYPE